MHTYSTKLIRGIRMCLQAEDLLDDILSFEAGSLGDGLKDSQSGSLSSLPDLNIKHEPLLLTDAEVHALAKDRQKKDNHNMSEYNGRRMRVIPSIYSRDVV